MVHNTVPRISTLIGHAAAISFLRQAVASGKMAHGYIFSGPEGIGKFAAAHAFGALLMCRERRDEACGNCPACRRVAAGTHADLIVVRRVDKKKYITVDLIRDLVHSLELKPLWGGSKVAIIRDADEMNEAAQNCLLKTLEEPFPDTVIVLVTANLAALKPTIISRCQVVNFPPLARAQVAEALVRIHGWDEQEARCVAAFSDGSLGRALSIERELFTRERADIIARLRELPRVGFAGVSALASQIAGKKEDAARQSWLWRLSLLISWYRDNIRRELLGPEAEVQNEDLRDVAAQLDWRASLQSLQDIHDAVKALKANANRVLTVEALLLRLRSRERSW